MSCIKGFVTSIAWNWHGGQLFCFNLFHNCSHLSLLTTHLAYFCFSPLFVNSIFTGRFHFLVKFHKIRTEVVECYQAVSVFGLMATSLKLLLWLFQTLGSWQLPSSILAVLFRVAKCHGYDGSIRVKILVSWGKSLEEHIVWLNQAFFENVCKISVYKLAKLEEWSTAVLLLVLFRFSTKTVAIYAFFFG